MLLLFLTGFLGGLIGALTGLGGSAIATPILVSYLGVPLRVAIGSGIITTIANSSTSGAGYLARGIANLRVGYSLAIATILGSIVGVIININIPTKILYIVFGVVLAIAPLPGIISRQTKDQVFIVRHNNQDPISMKLGLKGSYYDENKKTRIEYVGSRYPLSFLSMMGAGIISGLLGIGAGAFKVLSMDYVMGLPFKVSTATSSFMIGLTATSGGIQYLVLGYADPLLVSLLVPGVILGSYVSSRILNKLASKTLRYIFTAVVWLLAIEMIWRGL
ncbi:MAG TPA: sulfite exporter TauE/SafE family protein [Sulfolobales archaeon]|nr:sulfite exporter TauE/SafE family protein [Sulfolobales archaeon]